MSNQETLFDVTPDEDCLDYSPDSILSHNGTVTVHNTKTGGHRTFRIKTQPGHDKTNQRLVELLTGPDNEFTYQAFGRLVVEDGKPRVILWREHQTSEEPTYRVFASLLEHPEHWRAKGAEYLFAVRCRRCNRKLTTPESVRSGIGPICAGRE